MSIYHIIDRIYSSTDINLLYPSWFINQKRVPTSSFQETISELPYQVKVVAMAQSAPHDNCCTTWTVVGNPK